ncbi:hypothetical protein K493DRAFT_372364 [Basidiobolus meristosporus CBS 931.73]|uniref:Uncharacterized protein n=1 Tax=Basidiobolus meristosporus CBS 931.73 TaxID=1314790 RepID=A0A1Y1Z877_9FUNG|nr:hypothetical protein K493DRAFT_372364 [Basidiobolus meristosporus CBS 931.73]|eukprot:ORY06207.1 hypothetical protein K493DRAFT_372364 [Basidiobolus meristosporus CBS 931.73]
MKRFLTQCLHKASRYLRKYLLHGCIVLLFILGILVYNGNYVERFGTAHFDCSRLQEFPQLEYSGLTGDILEDDNAGKLDEFADSLQKRYNSIMELAETYSCPPTQTIAYVCGQDDLCGGVGDRIQGVISTFYLALLTNSLFHIEWSKPLPLQEFIVPNRTGIDWIGAGSTKALGSKIPVFDYGYPDSLQIIEDANSMNFLKSWSRYEHINIHSNQAFWVRLTKNNTWGAQAAKNYQLDQLPPSYLYTIASRLLLSTPSNKLQPYIDEITKQWKDKTAYKIGLHIRTGGEGAWDDPKRVDVSVAVGCFVDEAIAIYNDFAKNHPSPPMPIFFVATDSQHATDLLREQLGKFNYTVYTSHGNITHLDRAQEGNLFDDNVRTYADWFVLHQMDALVITRSGFSETVAAMTLKPTRRYVSGSQCKFTNFADVLSMDDWYPRYTWTDYTELGRIP